MRSNNFKETDSVPFGAHFCVALVLLCCFCSVTLVTAARAQGQSDAKMQSGLSSETDSDQELRTAPQRQEGSGHRPFDLKAVKVDQNQESQQGSLRIARPGTALNGQAQDNGAPLTGNVGADRLTPLIDENSFQQDVGKLDHGRSSAFDLNAQKLGAGAKENKAIMQLPLTSRLLADYQIELIVDRSLSMRKRDCPGGLSRWEWCGVQAGDLAKAIAPYLPNGITIIPFASQYDVYQNASAQSIADLFNNPNFQFGTRLAEPLTDRLNNFFAKPRQNKKPLLIAVITDGVPYPPPEPDMVRDELIHSTKKMHGPNEVTVVFFQIGGRDRFGRSYLQDLGHNLVNEGARFDYVHTISFDQLMNVGLPQALVQTVQSFSKSQ